jgi:hypothetical protein
MSKTIHYSLKSEPHLLDLVDDEWRRDKLPDDSKLWALTGITGAKTMHAKL